MAKTPEEKKADRAARRKARSTPNPHRGTPAFLACYPKSYGAWAGQPQGNKPDHSRCCESVYRDHRSGQCSYKNGHGPAGAHCAIHDPSKVAARQAESARRHKERWANDKATHMLGSAGGALAKALLEIEAGHNDSRGRAREALEELRARGWEG